MRGKRDMKKPKGKFEIPKVLIDSRESWPVNGEEEELMDSLWKSDMKWDPSSKHEEILP